MQHQLLKMKVIKKNDKIPMLILFNNPVYYLKLKIN
jgi:hypothetical protein